MYDYSDPSVPCKLLDALQRIGFTDDAFWRLHHRRLIGQQEPIERFKKYCLRVKSFKSNGNNALVAKRLERVLMQSELRAKEMSEEEIQRAFCQWADDSFREMPPVSEHAPEGPFVKAVAKLRAHA